MTTEQAASFIGTKALRAAPMTLGAYVVYRGWVLRPTENPFDEGYLTKDIDREHIDFIPKAVFESTYRVAPALGDAALTPYQVGVVVELADMEQKLKRLRDFITYTDEYGHLPAEERARIRAQVVVMEQHIELLLQRAAQFAPREYQPEVEPA